MLPDNGPATVRALIPSDAAAYRSLRLQALAEAPAAFSSSYEEESAYSLEIFRARIPNDGASVILGAFAGNTLVGMAGFLASERVKTRHKGTLWGVYVQPDWRSRGLGKQLVGHVIAHAARHVLLLQAVVVTTNESARRMYHRLGFVPYGIERNALRIDSTFYDEELLVLEFSSAG